MELTQSIQQAADLANQGKFAEADKICREIIAINDRFHPAYHLLGQLASHAGRNDIAVSMLEHAAALDPNRAYYQRDLAEVLVLSAKAQDALSIIKRALVLEPDDAQAHFILGLATMSLGMLDNASEAFQQTIELEPNFSPAHNNLGSLLERSGELKEAKKAYSEAVRIESNNAQAQNNLASILIAEGDIKAAKDHLEAAIKASPDYIEAHHNLSALKKYQKDDLHITRLQSIAADPSKLTTDNQIRLEFVLGKAYSDMGDYDRAFSHYKNGNQKKRATFEYCEDEATKFNSDLKTSFPSAFFQGPAESQSNEPIPIFIVGMPRSGSTLVEQILVSHSEVSTAGELTVLNKIVKDHVEEFPKGVDKLSNAEFAEIGNAYLNVIRKKAPESKYIIDKMPGNYRLLGLIARALPQAKIINTTRNPLDCCFSVYTRLFLETLHYGYDLEELGNYYLLYQNLMAHWHSVLPDGVLTDAAYESVVGDLRGEAEKMVDFIGLRWQEELLEFYLQETNVLTASAAQVRQPIYKSSIERWKPFQKELEPLIRALNIVLS